MENIPVFCTFGETEGVVLRDDCDFIVAVNDLQFSRGTRPAEQLAVAIQEAYLSPEAPKNLYFKPDAPVAATLAALVDMQQHIMTGIRAHPMFRRFVEIHAGVIVIEILKEQTLRRLMSIRTSMLGMIEQLKLELTTVPPVGDDGCVMTAPPQSMQKRREWLRMRAEMDRVERLTQFIKEKSPLLVQTHSAMLSDSTDEAREASQGPFFINLEWDTSLLDLDSKICQLQTELMSQIQQGSIRHLTVQRSKIEELELLQRKLIGTEALPGTEANLHKGCEAESIAAFAQRFVAGKHKVVDVRRFVEAAAKSVLKHSQKHNVAGQQLPSLEAVEIAVESALLPKIYKRAIKMVEKADDDQALYSKFQSLTWVSQDNFDIKVELKDPGVVPYYMAIAKLRGLNYCTTAVRKLYAVCDAAKAIYDNMYLLAPMLGAVGAEDFFEIWNYVVLKASIQNLASNINFIEAYAKPEMLSSSQLAYYFTSLCAATEFIRGLTPEALVDCRQFVEHRRSRYSRNEI